MRTVIACAVVAVLSAGLTYVVAHQRACSNSGDPPQDLQVHNKANPAETAEVRGNAEAEQKVALLQEQKPAALEDELSLEERTNVRVYKRANRSVVNINTRSVEVDDFLMMARPREGSGSGSVLDRKGHILTNYHVVEGARRIAVTLHDGNNYEAKLVGSDPNNDLAVLRIKAKEEVLNPIGWGDSTKLLVGVRVFAIGNPFGLERTLTTGIVSSLNRSLRTDNNRLIRGIIQTDAAINPGNSGGPLLNRQGKMVGITTAIIGRAGQNSGIGLAIPSSTVRRVVTELIEFGRVIRPDSGIFSVYELDQGLLIARLVPDGPAQKAGLRGPKVELVRRGGFLFRSIDRSQADLVIAVDGKRVRTFDDFLTQIERKRPGDQVTLIVIREGERVDVTLTLAESKG